MGETDCGGNWVLFLWAVLSKSLIQFSIEGQGCVPSLLFDLRPNCPGGNEDNGDPLQKVPGTHCRTQCPDPVAIYLGFLFLYISLQAPDPALCRLG